jgi:hypothetical protein
MCRSLWADDRSGLYRSPNNGFSISFPDNWIQENNHHTGEEISAYDPSSKLRNGHYIAGIVVFSEPNLPPMSLEGFVEFGRRHMEEGSGRYGKYKYYGSGKTTIDGFDAIWLAQSITNKSARKSKSFTLIHNNRRYVMQCVDDVESFDQFESQCNDIVQTFHFAQP